MKIWKLIAGILSVLFFFVVTLQSCAAGFVNTIESNGGSSGTVGMLVGFLLFVGGIVSICVKNGGKGGNIALIIIFGFAALLGLAGHGNYSDLIVWSIWCLINAILAVISLIKS